MASSFSSWDGERNSPGIILLLVASCFELVLTPNEPFSSYSRAGNQI
jgi:hypothetical protein